MVNQDNTSFLIETWRKIILGDQKSWVLFKNGTIVIIMEPTDDLSNQALKMIKEWGPVAAATSAGDFSVIDLKDHPGWAVSCHHPDIFTYVGVNEVEDINEIKNPYDQVTIGMIGRTKRDTDSREAIIIHVEDKTII